jgi:hypothetical protein
LTLLPSGKKDLNGEPSLMLRPFQDTSLRSII